MPVHDKTVSDFPKTLTGCCKSLTVCCKSLTVFPRIRLRLPAPAHPRLPVRLIPARM